MLALAESEGSPDGIIDGTLQSKFSLKITRFIEGNCTAHARIRGARREVITHSGAIWSRNTNGCGQYADRVIYSPCGRGRLDSRLPAKTRGEFKQLVRGCRTDGSAEPR